MLHSNFPQNMQEQEILYGTTGHLERDPNLKNYKLTSNECMQFWKLCNYFFQNWKKLCNLKMADSQFMQNIHQVVQGNLTIFLTNISKIQQLYININATLRSTQDLKYCAS